MLNNSMTILEATQFWVRGFNSIPQSMLALLMNQNPDDWHEVTLPSLGDSVYVYSADKNGEIISIDNGFYDIELSDGSFFSLDNDEFEVIRYDSLPIWATLWSFGDSLDIDWLESGNGISVMSECGFRIFFHDDFGYFFGIDGAGYDFYEAHWIPLYLARGLQWHSDNQSFAIHDSWDISDVDNLIEVNDYCFSPSLDFDDKKMVLLKMTEHYDPDVGYNFDALNSALLELFAHRLVTD